MTTSQQRSRFESKTALAEFLQQLVKEGYLESKWFFDNTGPKTIAKKYYKVNFSDNSECRSDENRKFLDILNGQSNSSVIPMCSKCLIPAEYDEEEWLYRCPNCKVEGCIVG